MAKSKMILNFNNWGSGNPTGTLIAWEHNGGTRYEEAVIARTNSFQFNVAGDNGTAANNFHLAMNADFSGVYTVTRAGQVVTITAVADNVVFSDFSCSQVGRVLLTSITNEVVDPVINLTSATISEADTNPCTTIKVTLTADDAADPVTWISPLPGNTGLEGTIPRSGGPVTITVEDDDGDEDSISVTTPAVFDNTVLNSIGIVGDPTGLYGSVTVYMNATTGVPLIFQYSMDNVTFQTTNVFTSVLPGLYTMYIKDQFGCTISSDFEVTLATTRPPVYRLIPKSNSFGWFETQAPVSSCANPYNGTNAEPNDYKPTRWLNPRYFQPWCSIDLVTTQFRSNYDTHTISLINMVTDAEVKPITAEQKTSNIGKRQIMDATIYDREDGQTGVYWITGNIYATDGVTVIDTYDLSGQLPEWAKVGQKFFLSGTAGDGLFEIKQIIFDSLLLVNAVVIDRIYTDLTETVIAKVDASYNRLNYEVFEFITDLSDVPEGCYRIKLDMTDSLEEYQPSNWKSLPFIVVSGNRDLIYIESKDHVDDGIDYSTGIVHKQRFQGLFYEEDFPSTYETSQDSRKQLNKLDGRVEHTFVVEAIDVPYWVHEKLALFISKKNIRMNNLQVQFEEPFERERANTYSRVNLKANATVSGYEQYMTNAYDIL